MNKQQLSLRSISPQQLERIAAKLTLSSRALQMQILTLHRELAVTKRELVLSHQDLADGLVRLHEIDEYVREVQDELTVSAQTDAEYSFTEEEVRSRKEQLEELEEERQEELTLLEHVRAIIGLHESSQGKLRVVIAKLVKELCLVKRKEQLLVMLALRSRMVKLVPNKL